LNFFVHNGVLNSLLELCENRGMNPNPNSSIRCFLIFSFRLPEKGGRGNQIFGIIAWCIKPRGSVTNPSKKSVPSRVGADRFHIIRRVFKQTLERWGRARMGRKGHQRLVERRLHFLKVPLYSSKKNHGWRLSAQLFCMRSEHSCHWDEVA